MNSKCGNLIYRLIYKLDNQNYETSIATSQHWTMTQQENGQRAP
ncbi:unnamed protein product [Paramecium octaurelia]|uniref:Uncharacterized protein n=1 Tax=Paramecium octaurelia TaxID=43137 RepID=A0A8S1SYC8_PAROT|nr:unnamed protein product [Paramecium octaurelia]